MQPCSPNVQIMSAGTCKGAVRHLPPVLLFCSLVGCFLFLTAAAVKGMNL